jgi:hypothetical protein
MSFSPFEENVGFFREDSNMNIVRSVAPALQAITESERSMYTEVAPFSAEVPAAATGAVQMELTLEDTQPPPLTVAAAGVNADSDKASVASPGIKRVLSGISFTSVAHSDLDSVTGPGASAWAPAGVEHLAAGADGAAGQGAVIAEASGQPVAVASAVRSTSAKQAPPSSSAKPRSPTAASWLSSIASVDTAGSVSTLGSGGGNSGSSGGSAGSDLSSLTKSSIDIQRVFKGYLTRRTVSKMLTTRLVRVFSLDANRGTSKSTLTVFLSALFSSFSLLVEIADYYYDQKTGLSSWLPPKVTLSTAINH